MSSPFNPGSPLAQPIAHLFTVTLLIAAVVLALVAGLVVVAGLRYRHRDGAAEPRQVYGNRKLEVAWTVAPALLLLALLIMTLQTMAAADPAAANAGDPPDVVIIAHQWWWEVRYPQAGVVTANEIHIPTGQAMRTRIESADVIHSFWVPQLGRKMDAVPGHPNSLILQADAPGVYTGACSEFCGAQHAWMRIRVVAQSPADFAAWQQHQAQPAVAATGGAAAQGAQLFQERTCISCHTIDGTAAAAGVGPDLTHLASRETLGAGVLDNTAANLTLWMQNPQAIKPGSHMPNLKLNDTEITALVAYLENLK